VVAPASGALGEASHLAIGDLDGLPWLDVATHEPMLRSWMGPAGDAGGLSVRRPADIPTAVATTGRVSLHAAAAAQYYPRPDVRFVPVEGPPVQVAVATRTGDDRPAVAAFRRAAAVVVLAVPGDRDQQQIAPLGASPNLFGEIITIHARESDIEQHDLRLELGDHGHGGHSVRSGLDFVRTEFPEQ
jgi:hypothetical protein